jgi:hypothetical protein
LPWEITRDEHGKLVKVPVKQPFLKRIKISPRVVLAGLFALSIWTVVSIAAWKFWSGSIFGPHAPSLNNEADYQSAQEGFRFHAPDGWIQTFIAGKYPSGKAETERQVAGYNKKGGGQPAIFESTYIDLAPSTDLGSYLAKPSHGQTGWNLTAAATPLTVAGMEANRFILSAGKNPDSTTKEVVVIRRGDRVYFFTGVYHNSDADSQQKIRRAVDSIVW